MQVFVLGAGFSHHLSGKTFPLGNKLANIVKGLNIPALNKHIQDCAHAADDIEKALSRFLLDNYISDSEKDNLMKKVFMVFQKNMLVKNIDNGIIDNSKNIVKDLFKKDDVIITLNYDLLLEHLFAKSDIDMWSPYGNGYSNSVEGDIFTKNNGTEDCNQQKQNIRILKVHGSFNFFIQKFASTNEFSDIIDVLINESHVFFFDLKEMFENVKYKSFFVGKDALNAETIIIPTYVKPFAQNRTFMKLWHEAIEAIKKADIITIIGYRFPKEDVMMSFLFSCPDIEARKNSQKNKLKINILNTADEISKIKENIESVLRGNPDDIERNDFPLNESGDKDAYQELADFLKKT